MASVSNANTVAEVLAAVVSNGFAAVSPVEGGIAEGRVIFTGRNKAFPVQRADGTQTEVFRLNTNIVHDMAGFKAAYTQFKATPHVSADAAKTAWYEISDKFLVRANVWADNPTLNFLKLDGKAMGILNKESFTDGAGVAKTAWTLNRVMGLEPKAMASVAFTLEDGVAASAPAAGLPPVGAPPVLAGAPAGLDPNQSRMYNGQATTVAVLRGSGWTDAQIEQHTTL